ncbi:MAG: hypothetical protein IJJ70_05540 [Treponema sp.]|nr:hypothetical protein [bacterium]MBR0487150.1 hypothetical protein [Treponema sp.]
MIWLLSIIVLIILIKHSPQEESYNADKEIDDDTDIFLMAEAHDLF